MSNRACATANGPRTKPPKECLLAFAAAVWPKQFECALRDRLTSCEALCLHPIEHRLRDQAHPGRGPPEALGIYVRVFPYREARRDSDTAVDNDLLQPRPPAHLDARQHNRFLEACTWVNLRAGKQQ